MGAGAVRSEESNQVLQTAELGVAEGLAVWLGVGVVVVVGDDDDDDVADGASGVGLVGVGDGVSVAAAVALGVALSSALGRTVSQALKRQAKARAGARMRAGWIFMFSP
jgi:D-aminopeptidase